MLQRAAVTPLLTYHPQSGGKLISHRYPYRGRLLFTIEGRPPAAVSLVRYLLTERYKPQGLMTPFPSFTSSSVLSLRSSRLVAYVEAKENVSMDERTLIHAVQAGLQLSSSS